MTSATADRVLADVTGLGGGDSCWEAAATSAAHEHVSTPGTNDSHPHAVQR